LLIEKLTSEERKLFLKELKKVVITKPGEVLKPTLQELKQLAYHNSLPFIGFGFLDNFIMIMAGEYIDITLGKNVYENPGKSFIYFSKGPNLESLPWLQQPLETLSLT
jgi:hypothetical protein